MGYCVKLAAAETLAAVASLNQGYLHIDDIVGCDIFGTSPKIVTPPCINLNLTYLYYSSIKPVDERKNSADLPHKEHWQHFMRNKWSTTIALLLRQLLFKRGKGIGKSLHALVYLSYIECRCVMNWLVPRKRYFNRVLDAQKRLRRKLQHATHTRSSAARLRPKRK